MSQTTHKGWKACKSCTHIAKMASIQQLLQTFIKDLNGDGSENQTGTKTPTESESQMIKQRLTTYSQKPNPLKIIKIQPNLKKIKILPNIWRNQRGNSRIQPIQIAARKDTKWYFWKSCLSKAILNTQQVLDAMDAESMLMHLKGLCIVENVYMTSVQNAQKLNKYNLTKIYLRKKN